MEDKLVKNILKNLIVGHSMIPSPKEGISELRKFQRNLEAIHFCLDYINPKAFHKKKYYIVWKETVPSKLDCWIYDNLVDNEKFRCYLDTYLSQKENLGFNDVDKYILQKHYYRKAIKILFKKNKNFNRDDWVKPRFQYRYKRRSNLFLKDGREWEFDFRNTIETLFILNKNGDKHILARGGSASSGQRQGLTVFTAIFYWLGKRSPIKHYLIKYDSFNRFKYIGTFFKPIICSGFGSNFELPKNDAKKIRNGSLYYKDIKELETPKWLRL